MKKALVIVILFLLSFAFPSLSSAEKMPCAVVLEPVSGQNENAEGVALIHKVQFKPQGYKRTSVSMMASHLPDPSEWGDFDGYEGFVTIPNEISWRFKLYPTPEEMGPTWAGRFDQITAVMEDVKFEVRPSNSRSEKLGAEVLSGKIDICK
ncbi:hypothetical protein [Halobacillus yeomjeoni]|uniref:Uncharacterized protein n=1 Tax=Halobacillus yeomjeoni TaxID=311194 RepID=A0A931HV68_9BACI|nr:hypothetical protein [Halobacillus yeomjeoni]MBH0229736.1 hypothetical protein [Halobacillus yeomjeoni]